MTCCFTGHRNIAQTSALKTKIQTEAEKLIENGVNNFLCGGAIGFDMLAAETILKLKAKHNGVRLVLILPCKAHDKFWNVEMRLREKRIEKEADEVVYACENYVYGCIAKRNRMLVDESEYCICFLTESSGGTASTVRYAEQKHLKIINIAY